MHRTLSTYSKNGKMCNYNKWFRIFFSKKYWYFILWCKNLCVSYQVAFFYSFQSTLCIYTRRTGCTHGNVEIVSHIKNFIVSLIKIPALFYTFPIWTSKGWQYNGLQCWWGYGISSRTLVRLFSSGQNSILDKAKCTKHTQCGQLLDQKVGNIFWNVVFLQIELVTWKS